MIHVVLFTLKMSLDSRQAFQSVGQNPADPLETIKKALLHVFVVRAYSLGMQAVGSADLLREAVLMA